MDQYCTGDSKEFDKEQVQSLLAAVSLHEPSGRKYSDPVLYYGCFNKERREWIRSVKDYIEGKPRQLIRDRAG